MKSSSATQTRMSKAKQYFQQQATFEEVGNSFVIMSENIGNPHLNSKSARQQELPSGTFTSISQSLRSAKAQLSKKRPAPEMITLMLNNSHENHLEQQVFSYRDQAQQVYGQMVGLNESLVSYQRKLKPIEMLIREQDDSDMSDKENNQPFEESHEYSSKGQSQKGSSSIVEFFSKNKKREHEHYTDMMSPPTSTAILPQAEDLVNQMGSAYAQISEAQVSDFVSAQKEPVKLVELSSTPNFGIPPKAPPLSRKIYSATRREPIINADIYDQQHDSQYNQNSLALPNIYDDEQVYQRELELILNARSFQQMRDSISKHSRRVSKIIQNEEEKQEPEILVNDFRSMVLNNANITVQNFVSRQNSDQTCENGGFAQDKRENINFVQNFEDVLLQPKLREPIVNMSNTFGTPPESEEKPQAKSYEKIQLECQSINIGKDQILIEEAILQQVQIPQAIYQQIESNEESSERVSLEKSQDELSYQAEEMKNRISQIHEQMLELDQQRQNIESQKIQYGDLTTEMLKKDKLLDEKQNEIEIMQERLSDMQMSIEHLMNDLQKNELIRKHLHNHIQILKGNIRVFCRVKPLENGCMNSLELRTSSINQNCIKLTTTSQVELPSSLELMDQQQAKLYHFDCVFPPFTAQLDVFNEVKPFIQSAIDGENVCIFAYGQTGSGKTYTMEGPPYSSTFQIDGESQIDEISGILPRTAEFLFGEMERLTKQSGKKYQIDISSIEVYCDQVKDLYGIEGSNSDMQLITIKNRVVIQGQTWKRVDKVSAFLEFIKYSSSKRIFSNNGMNEHSSRSHHIFQIKIHGQNQRYEDFTSMLNIIDLAGSERRANLASKQQQQPLKASKTSQPSKNISKINPQSQLETESISINQSLTTLGRIFMMIADRKTKTRPQPPYRESKLTRILQESLSYETKTLMIVNVCSGSENLNQTKESLNFASKAMLAY